MTLELAEIIRPGTTRGLDFVILDELRKRTGVNPESVLKWTLVEMLCNALDKDATEIQVRVQHDGDFCLLQVSDNGSKKLSLSDIQRRNESPLISHADIRTPKNTSPYASSAGGNCTAVQFRDRISGHQTRGIDNLRTGSGRESRDWEYIRKYGKRKCESNALFKNDDTLKAAEDICRKAIEKYYENDALERFKKKEETSKQKLKDIYDAPIWKKFSASIDDLINSFSLQKPEDQKQPSTSSPQKEVEVLVDNKYYGRCPKCGASFNYDLGDVGNLVRCRFCNQPMRLRWKPPKGE